MNGYVCFYKTQRWETHAKTLFEAKDAAVKHFKVKPKQAYQVTAHLAEKEGVPVVHTAVD